MNPQNPVTNGTRPTDTDANKATKAGVLGRHPIGAGLGAVGVGAAAGAAGGAVAGPVGAVAGAVVGAVAGGIAGDAAAEVLDPAVETKYWQTNHSNRPYANSAFGYEEYAPAYRYGWESYSHRSDPTRSFESMEADLGKGWDKAKGASRLNWDKAKLATREAWNHVDSASCEGKHGKAKSKSDSCCN